MRIELIEGQDLCAFINRQIVQRYRGHNRAAPPAHGAIAAAWIDQAPIESHSEFNAPAMTLAFMNRPGLDVFDQGLLAEGIFHSHGLIPRYR